jgi:Domain of unknown function (DUF222)
VLAAAMVKGHLSRSWAVKVMSVTGKIPVPHRMPADRIIVAAARAGAQLHQLVFIAAEILARVAPPDEDDDGGFTDRQVRLETTLDGAGVLRGDLTPQCAAAVQAVLGEFARRRGREDRRSAGERWHDALEEAMTRLLGSDLAPKRNGHPVTALVHIGLADVLALDDGSVVQQQWSADLAARWAAHRAGASVQPGDGGAWIAGPAAKGIVCDAALFPIVEGAVDLAALDELIRLCVELDRHWHHAAADAADGAEGARGAGSAAGAGDDDADHEAADDADDETAGDAEDDAAAAERDASAERVRELCQAIIGRAVALLSGEAGLASHLRRNLLGHAGLGGRSLPLDAGDADAISWWLRRTVTTRDQSCRWPGGCDQPAAASQPHHLLHRHDHGPTSLANLYSLCPFHHLVAVHRWGWTLTVRGDGTLQATSPDRTRTYTETSRPPPPRPG